MLSYFLPFPGRGTRSTVVWSGFLRAFSTGIKCPVLASLPLRVVFGCFLDIMVSPFCNRGRLRLVQPFPGSLSGDCARLRNTCACLFGDYRRPRHSIYQPLGDLSGHRQRQRLAKRLPCQISLLQRCSQGIGQSNRTSVQQRPAIHRSHCPYSRAHFNTNYGKIQTQRAAQGKDSGVITPSHLFALAKHPGPHLFSQRNK